jgi:hypothetical protein
MKILDQPVSENLLIVLKNGQTVAAQEMTGGGMWIDAGRYEVSFLIDGQSVDYFQDEIAAVIDLALKTQVEFGNSFIAKDITEHPRAGVAPF